MEDEILLEVEEKCENAVLNLQERFKTVELVELILVV